MLRPIARRVCSSFGLHDRRELARVADHDRAPAAQARRVEQRRQGRHAGLLGDEDIEPLIDHQRRQVRAGQGAHHELRAGDHPRLEVAIGGGVRGQARLRQRPDPREPGEPPRERAQLIARRQGRDHRAQPGAEHVAERGGPQPRRLGEQRALRRQHHGQLVAQRLAVAQRQLDRLDPGAQPGPRGAVGLVAAGHHIAELGAEGGRGAAADPDRVAGLDRRGEPRPRRQLGQHLVDRGVGRRGQQDALALRAQLLDHVGERDGLAGAGRTPHEREVAVAAQLDRGALAGVERAVIDPQRGRGAGRRPPPEQGQRQRHAVAIGIEPPERAVQPVVQEPRRDHDRGRRGEVDRLGRGQLDPAIGGEPLDGHALLAARRAQHARRPEGEPVRARDLEAVAQPAEIEPAGQRDLRRRRGRTHGRDLALDPALERGHEPGEQRVHRGAPVCADPRGAAIARPA